MSAADTVAVTSATPRCTKCDVRTDHLPDVGVWICPYCGNASPSFADRDDGPVLGREDPEQAIIAVRGLVSTKSGLKAVLDTPYHAKEDLKALPIDGTQRRWNPDLTSWTVTADSREFVLDQLADAGWSTVDLVELRRERGDPE